MGNWFSSISIRLVSILIVSAAVSPAATIEGRVVDRLTGAPLARSRVLLMPLRGGGAQVSLMSDPRGRFSIQAQPGAYVLGAERVGYAFTWYGQRRWNGRGAPIVVDKDSRFTAELQLSRLGAITGEVRDENGASLWDIPVTVYQDSKPLQPAGQAVTDDRGFFRISGLSPGRYRVRTGYKKLDENTSLLPTFFGNTPLAEPSQVVNVELDSEAQGIVIVPVPGNLLRLSGQVTFPGAVVVRLFSDTGPSSAMVDNSGRFSFDELPPGVYDLFAESQLTGAPLSAYQRVWLKSDVEDLKLDGAAPPTVRFRCRAAAGDRPIPVAASLTLVRTLPPGEARTEHLNCGGSGSAAPGVWRLNTTTSAEGYVSALESQGKQLDLGEITLQPGDEVEILATISGRAASITGTVTGGDGKPAADVTVVLRPLDPAFQQRLPARTATQTGPDGVFALRGLPPGRYAIAASLQAQSPDEIDWSDPALKTVELDEGQFLNLALQL